MNHALQSLPKPTPLHLPGRGFDPQRPRRELRLNPLGRRGVQVSVHDALDRHHIQILGLTAGCGGMMPGVGCGRDRKFIGLRAVSQDKIPYFALLEQTRPRGGGRGQAGVKDTLESLPELGPLQAVAGHGCVSVG